jgi:hypothetical protein
MALKSHSVLGADFWLDHSAMTLGQLLADDCRYVDKATSGFRVRLTGLYSRSPAIGE